MDATGILRTTDSIYIWDIQNFSSKCSKVGESIKSPIFTISDKFSNGIECFLQLYPFGDKEESKSFLSIYLNCKVIQECIIPHQFYLWDNIKIDTKDHYSSIYSKEKSCWGVSKFLNRDGDEFKNHLAKTLNNTLSMAVSFKTHYMSSLNLHAELITSFEAFFLSENLSDVTIEVDNKKLKAHKIILSARSTVFSAMFKHNMIENKKNIVKITDISYDVMKEVLRYMYCEKVENLDTIKYDLLAAANKYKLDLLKKDCEKYLLENMNPNNVCEILRIAHLYLCIYLKREAIQFIIQNMSTVIPSIEFTKIKDAELLNEILQKIAQKRPPVNSSIIGPPSKKLRSRQSSKR